MVCVLRVQALGGSGGAGMTDAEAASKAGSPLGGTGAKRLRRRRRNNLWHLRIGRIWINDVCARAAQHRTT